jgi:hypothetical protein
MMRSLERLVPAGTAMKTVRERMEHEAFGCRDVRGGVWNDRVRVDFLLCRRVEPAGSWNLRIWEIAFFSRDSQLVDFFPKQTLADRKLR